VIAEIVNLFFYPAFTAGKISGFGPIQPLTAGAGAGLGSFRSRLFHIGFVDKKRDSA
jgi:hypothetical protein